MGGWGGGGGQEQGRPSGVKGLKGAGGPQQCGAVGGLAGDSPECGAEGGYQEQRGPSVVWG